MSEQKAGGMTEFFFFAIITVAMLVGAWYGLRKPIMWGSFYASYWMFTAYEYLPLLMTSHEYQSLVNARQSIPSINPTKHGLKALMQLFEYHGYIWRWIVIPLMIWIGWKTKRSVVRFKFTRELRTVYDLIEIQRHHFPASAIIYKKDLLNQHAYVGPWATFALPLDFALDNALLWTSKDTLDINAQVDESKMVRVPALTPDQKLQPFPVKRQMMPLYKYVAFSIPRANETFTRQLGPLWQGADKLPPLERALYAVFCTQAAGHQGEAWTMIEQLAFSWKQGEVNAEGKLITPHFANTNGTDALLDKYASQPAVKAIVDQHAHVANVMFATLALARKKGRLLHSNFLWLKPVNRSLWYALCGQGGQAPYWEAAGAWAHMLVESMVGRRITTPMVAGAVDAMKESLSREHWIDPGEHSEEAQQRLVAEANEQLDAEIGALQGAGRNGGGLSNPRANTSRKRREDDEP